MELPDAINEAQRRALLAIADRLIPEDEDPSASQAGFGRFFDRTAAPSLDERGIERLRASLDRIDAVAHERASAAFADLEPREQDALLRAMEAGEFAGSWNGAAPFLFQLTNWVGQSYYGDPGNGGNEGARSWKRIGFRPETKRPYVAPELPALDTRDAASLPSEFDAIVVGAGAGGGIVACVLAEAGWNVLLLERGDALAYHEVGRDHLRNHRLAAYGHNTGPDLEGHPRVSVRDDVERVVRPHEPAYQNNAMTLGGGTRVYAGQAWRYAAEDFRMESLYGRPDGSSLSDWPIGYDELAPFYDLAEREIGVSGELGHRHAAPRGPYPMPPVAPDRDGPVLRAAAGRLGWTARAVPLAINSVPYAGRPACAACGVCVGFACGSEAKGGTANTVIPRALATGRCSLVTRAHATRIEVDERGQACGVSFVVPGEDARSVRARTVVVSAGAIETARLLLLSTSSAHPEGLGNAHDQVGRNLQGHLYSGAVGVHSDEIRTSLGPGNSTATCDFNHGNEGIIGGGLLANESPFPIHFWSFFQPDIPRWGAEAKAAMAETYRRTLVVMGPIQEIPSPDARVLLDPKVRDQNGLPVARLTGHIHPASIPPSRFLATKAEEWVRATGATRVRSWGGADPKGLSAGQHQAGTCRMGADPASSVTDPEGRVHGQSRLYLADGSLHVTNGGYNPMLTIMANAYRVADGILRAD